MPICRDLGPITELATSVRFDREAPPGAVPAALAELLRDGVDRESAGG